MEVLNLPLSNQLDNITTFLANQGTANFAHLFTGTPVLGQSANLANMQANEVSGAITWYEAQSVVYNSEPQTDANVPFQLDIVANSLNWNYSNGSGSDPSVTVTGYFVQQSSNVLVGYALLPTPETIAAPYNAVDIQPYVPFPSQT